MLIGVVNTLPVVVSAEKGFAYMVRDVLSMEYVKFITYLRSTHIWLRRETMSIPPNGTPFVWIIDFEIFN